ncbi:MAG: CvpA family protein [Planctomycetota bacterium]
MIAETAQPLAGSVLNWVDLICIALLGATLVYGVVRGFMLQLLSILVIAGSAVAASLTYRGIAGWVLGRWPDLSDQAARGIGFTIVFLLLLAVGTGLAYLLRRQMAKAKMLAHDRLLGGVLGLVKGWLLIVILLQLALNFTMPADVNSSPTGLSKAIVDSRSAAVARWSTHKLLVFLPQGVADRLKHYDRLNPADEGSENEAGREEGRNDARPDPDRR